MKQLVLLAALVACDSKKPAAPAGAPATNGSLAPKLAIPVATSGTATTSGPPPVLVVLDTGGRLRLGAVKTWAAVATFDPTSGKPADDSDELRKVFMEAEERHDGAEETVAFFGNRPRGLDAVVGTGSNVGSGAEDDASGQGAVAMALDEGKMGKPGQPRPPVDPHAAAEGALGELGGAFGPDPNRRATVAGELRGVQKHPIALVLADPHAKAARVIEVITLTTGVLGVLRSGAVVPLKLQIDRAHDRPMPEDAPTALDVHVHATTLEPALDAAKAAMAKRDPWNPVDLIVDPDVEAQRLVDVIVQFDQAGAHVLGLGAAK